MSNSGVGEAIGEENWRKNGKWFCTLQLGGCLNIDHLIVWGFHRAVYAWGCGWAFLCLYTTIGICKLLLC